MNAKIIWNIPKKLYNTVLWRQTRRLTQMLARARHSFPLKGVNKKHRNLFRFFFQLLRSNPLSKSVFLDLDYWLTAGVTGQQEMLIPPRHLFPPLLYLGARIGLLLIFFLFFFFWITKLITLLYLCLFIPSSFQWYSVLKSWYSVLKSYF